MDLCEACGTQQGLATRLMGVRGPRTVVVCGSCARRPSLIRRVACGQSIHRMYMNDASHGAAPDSSSSASTGTHHVSDAVAGIPSSLQKSACAVCGSTDVHVWTHRWSDGVIRCEPCQRIHMRQASLPEPVDNGHKKHMGCAKCGRTGLTHSFTCRYCGQEHS